MIDEKIATYMAELARSDHPILREMEALAADTRFPIVGPEVGRLFYVLTATSGARRVLELGSGFGYSAFWFARATGPQGRVILTDHSSERLQQAQDFLGRAGLRDRIQVETGDALELLDRIPGPMDIIFNDVDKEDYPRVLAPAARLLRQGGLLISDNMLWHGKVAEPDPADQATQGVVALTRALFRSDEFLTALLPIRDGLTVSIRL